MAVELASWLDEKLKFLPADHPDRSFLEDLRGRVEDHNYLFHYVDREASDTKFSSEQRKRLEREGFVIYELSGRSIKELGGEVEISRFFLNPYIYDFGGRTSTATEVAVKPNKFLVGWDSQGFSQNKYENERLAEEISQRIKGVKCVIGEANQYAELALIHLKATGENLFGSDYEQYESDNWVRTNTFVGPHIRKLVSISFHFNMCFNSAHPDAAYCGLVAPLVVPADYQPFAS